MRLPSLSRRAGPRDVLFVGAWAMFAAIVIKDVSGALYDPDMWWHLAAGRWMFATHAIPRADVFSHTMTGAPWIDMEWAAELAMQALHALGGLGLLYAAKVFLSIASILATVSLLRTAGARRWALYTLAWLAFWLLRPRFLARPELATLVFFPLCLDLLLRARASSAIFRRRLPWFLFPLFVLWVNVHAGFIYGLGAIVLLSVGARWAGDEADVVRMFDRAVVLALVALPLNPYGFRWFGALLTHLVDFARFPGIIEEWRGPTWQTAPAYYAATLGAALAAIAAIRRPPALTRLLFPAAIVFVGYGLRAVRNTALPAFVALPFVASAVAEAPALANRAGIRRLAGVLSVLAAIPAAPSLAAPWPRRIFHAERFPVGAADFLERARPAGRLYNTYAFGGYLEWRGHPVFFDGRYIFYPLLIEEELAYRRAAIDLSGAGFESLFRRHGVDVAVVQDNGPRYHPAGGVPPFTMSSLNIAFPRATWALVYVDDAAYVFVRRTPANAALIADREYKALWPYNLDQMSYLLQHGDLPRSAVAAELDRLQREIGPTAHGRAMAALLR